MIRCLAIEVVNLPFSTPFVAVGSATAPLRPGRARCHRTRSHPLFHGRQVGLTQRPMAAVHGRRMTLTRRLWCHDPHPPTTLRAPQLSVPRGFVRGGDVRGGGGPTMLPPVSLRDLLVGPAATSSLAAGVSPHAGPACPRGGGKGDATTPARGSSSPHAAGAHVHRPRPRALSGTRSSPPARSAETTTCPRPPGRRAACARRPLRGPLPSAAFPPAGARTPLLVRLRPPPYVAQPWQRTRQGRGRSNFEIDKTRLHPGGGVRCVHVHLHQTVVPWISGASIRVTTLVDEP